MANPCINTWKYSLVVCNALTWMLGVCIFGLALGTVKDEVFELHYFYSLGSLFGMACADVAAGVALWVVSFLGAATLVYRTAVFHLFNTLCLVIMLLYQISTGIATLVICAEEVSIWRAQKRIICERRLAAQRSLMDMANPALTQKLNNTATASGKSAVEFIWQFVLGDTGRDCTYFNDLMTPAGALLIIGAILMTYMLMCAINLCQCDKESGLSVQGRRRKGCNGQSEVQL